MFVRAARGRFLLRTLLLFVLTLTPALAANVSLIAGGPILGDGTTPVTLHLWGEGLDERTSVRIKPSAGRVADMQVGNQGLATFSFMPPVVAEPTQVRLEVRVRGSAVRLDQVIEVAVVPAYGGTLGVQFDPPEYKYGQGAVMLKVSGTATPQAVESRKLLVRASAGAIENLTATGDGDWAAQWKAPGEMEGSQPVLFTVVDAAAPEDVLGWGTLPVLVKQSITLQAPPSSQNVLTVGDRTFGPVPASPAGTVAFDVELHPKHTQGTLKSVGPGAAKAEAVVELPLVDAKRMEFMPFAAGIEADPDTPYTVHLVVVQPDGTGQAGARPVLTVSSGQISEAKATPVPGVYKAFYKPTKDAGSVTITAVHDGQRINATMDLVPTVPRVSIEVSPNQLEGKTRDVAVTATVKDAGGAALAGVKLAMEADNGARLYTPKDAGDGTYTTKMRIGSKAAQMVVRVEPPTSPTGLSPSRLVMWPAQTVVAANGTSDTLVAIIAVDRYGVPVPGVEIKLAVPSGAGSLPPSATTNARGFAWVTYKAASEPGLATLRAEGAGLWTEASVLGRSAQMTTAALPPTGSSTQVSELSRWQATIPATLVRRVGVTPAVGPPANVVVSTIPEYTTPGAALLVVARLSDAAGLPVAGKRPRISATKGTVGSVTDNGDGSYSVPVQLPPGEDGPLTLTVAAGDATGTANLPTLASLGGNPANANVSSGGNTGGGSGNARAPRASRGGGGGGGFGGGGPSTVREGLRAYGGLATVPHVYVQSSTPGDNAPGLAAFAKGNLFRGNPIGAPALNLGTTYQLGGSAFVADARLRYYFHTYETDDGNTFAWQNLNAMAGLRAQGDINGRLGWYGLLQLHYTSALWIGFIETKDEDDEPVLEADPGTIPLIGGRVGGGIAWVIEGSPISGESELAFTLVPFPVNYHAGNRASYDLDGPLDIWLGLNFDMRSVSFQWEDEDIRVFHFEQEAVAGVGYQF